MNQVEVASALLSPELGPTTISLDLQPGMETVTQPLMRAMCHYCEAGVTNSTFIPDS